MSPFVIVFCVCLAACAQAASVPMFDLEAAEEHFERFIQDFNKQYTSEEEKQTRFTVFKENLKRANTFNAQSEHASFGITQFMDLTVKEFVSRYTGLDANLNFTGQCQVVTDADLPNVNVPDSFDWREKNAVTKVKNQGQCGSCYAFSASGAVEGQYAIKYGKLQEFSEQQTVDCDEDSLGCGGGLMTSAFSSMIEEGGLESESDYPYIAKSQSCQFQASKAAVELTGCINYNLKSQEKLKQLVATIGPISIAVKGAPFLTYKGGIISDDACNEGDVNHAILLVGYGTGITKFMDLTVDEFVNRYSCIPANFNFTGQCNVVTDSQLPKVYVPDSFDWRQQNVVTRVKVQGECGSCYAFSASGAVEGQYAIKNGQLLEFSEQQTVDCDKGSGGCGGGLMTSAFSSMIELGGLESETDYPYVGQAQSCQFQAGKAAVRLTGCNNYNIQSQERLKKYIKNRTSFTIHVTPTFLTLYIKWTNIYSVKSAGFHLYTGGVMNDQDCNTGEVNHAILLVGYGTENGMPYWLAKNSWDTVFGENGYIKFPRGDNYNSCGVMNQAMASPIIA
ncbi:hypothetical protein HW555_009187 [Spodoptera exigua]|uniref:Uncharacterized protein n=1 Tax=Spodoptera exigua TaxID=7107 RepID=A0A835GDH9_SPOEX|nr:hypothetical protein HW555_009187 [Spodoptera exigua]